MITTVPFEGSLLHWATLIFALTAPLFFLSEASGLAPFGYSKFADRTARFRLPARTGMFLLYLPAAIAFPVLHFLLAVPVSPWHVLVTVLGMVHFSKRCAEVLWLHRFSGVTNLVSTGMIASLYLTTALMVELALSQDMAADWAGGTWRIWDLLGLLLWCIGLGGNAYHHWLLANLRVPGETGYKVPRGGLFPWVACPHYLFELIGWVGFSLVMSHITSWVILFTMSCYLAGRSYSTLRWYRERDLDIPSGWRRLIPFVF